MLYYIYIGKLNGLQDAVQTLYPEEKMLANALEAKTERLTYGVLEADLRHTVNQVEPKKKGEKHEI